MNNFFSLNLASTEVGPVAYSPEDSPLSFELISLLKSKNEIPYDLVIKKVSETKKGLIINDELDTLNVIWEDYLPNNVGLPLMSEKLKKIIENNLSGKESIDWLKCKVWAMNEFKIYYSIRFNSPLDVLDFTETKYLKGTDFIITPCFSMSKIENLSIFPMPTSDDLYKLSLSIYINETIKKSIEKEKISGVEFFKVKIS